MCTAKYSKPRSVMSVMVGPSLPPCRDEGVPVHHDPVHGPNHHGHYGTRFSIFSCTQQPKNLHLKPIYFTVPKHTRYQSWVFLYISLPTKYTISGSILHYKVGLTLSFLSLISRGVGGIQKGNASI